MKPSLSVRHSFNSAEHMFVFRQTFINKCILMRCQTLMSFDGQIETKIMSVVSISRDMTEWTFVRLHV